MASSMLAESPLGSSARVLFRLVSSREIEVPARPEIENCTSSDAPPAVWPQMPVPAPEKAALVAALHWAPLHAWSRPVTSTGCAGVTGVLVSPACCCVVVEPALSPPPPPQAVSASAARTVSAGRPRENRDRSEPRTARRRIRTLPRKR
ncbi:hypothetical protein D3C87_1449290 [compost metagenome]